MPIKRCSDQSSSGETLVEFYQKTQTGAIGIHMLKLIDSLNQIFTISEIYGLTSLYDLVLLPKSTWKSEWIVKFITNGTEYVLYKYGEDKKLEKRIVYTTENELIENIIQIMKASNYWKDIPEFQ